MGGLLRGDAEDLVVGHRLQVAAPEDGRPEADSLLWRGVGPPNGDTYGGDMNGCNLCHAACAANDYVSSPLLRLGSFR